MKPTYLDKAALGLCVAIVSACHAQQPLASVTPDATSTVTTPGGTAGVLPAFSGTSSIVNSRLFYSNGQLGIGKVPGTALDVEGESHFAGAGLFLPFATATASKGYNSHSLWLQTSAFNSSTKAAVGPYMQFSAEPVGNNTASPSASLHLLYNGGSGKTVESGLYFNADGTIHFAPAQTFPIAAGPQGPAGPAGPQGPTGPAGPSGTLTLPFSGQGSSSGYIFSVENEADGGSGISVALGSNGGVAIQASGGYSSEGGEAGAGLVASGGSSTDGRSSPAIGISATGGDGPSPGGMGNDSPGATGLLAYGGYGDLGGGNGIEAYGGDGHFQPEGIGIIAVGGNQTQVDEGDPPYSPVAGVFVGDVNIQGNLSKSGGSFKIDDPLDPANKYLYHSFVESPDMKNIYDGNVTTDGRGEAVVTMPEYFEALNRDFRYQLTAIGQFAQAIVATKIANGFFTIKTDKPNVEVSWMVTGIRQDAWANAHRIPIEQEKSARDKGHYLHPELFGQPKEAQILPAGISKRKQLLKKK